MANKQQPGVGKTIISDFRRDDNFKNWRRDWRSLKEFYLNYEQRERLNKMNPVKKFFWLTGWLLKSMFLKMTPLRRILIVISFIFLFAVDVSTNDGHGTRVNVETGLFSTALIVLVLMLELKDKLLAQSELRQGRSVQIALMPEKQPEIEGWDIWLYTRPANDVGGDMVDFMELNEKHYGIAIGDVSGKGLGAALLMAKLQATLRALAPDEENLSKLAKRVNAIFYRDTMRKSFASMAFLEISGQSGKINMINAGHMPPLVIRKDNIEEIPKNSPAIGLARNVTFIDKEIELEKNDLLIAYSDGLTEAKNEYGEFYEKERFMKIIERGHGTGAEKLGNLILDAADYFIGEAQLHDDLSLIIMRKL